MTISGNRRNMVAMFLLIYFFLGRIWCCRTGKLKIAQQGFLRLKHSNALDTTRMSDTKHLYSHLKRLRKSEYVEVDVHVMPGDHLGWSNFVNGMIYYDF